MINAIPLCHDIDDAMAFAYSLPWDVPDEMLQRLQLPECNTPCVITITAFDDGEPVSRVIVRDYEDEV